jgi:hypothetical protein
MTIEELQAGYAQLEDLVRTLANHTAALSTRVERQTLQTTRIANASEDTNALALNEVQASRLEKQSLVAELKSINERLAVLLKKVEDTEDAAEDAKVAVREATGAHRLLEPNAPRHVPREESDGDRRDPWYARLARAFLRARPVTLLLMALLVLVVATALGLGIRLLSALDHSHLLPTQEQKQEK